MLLFLSPLLFLSGPASLPQTAASPRQAANAPWTQAQELARRIVVSRRHALTVILSRHTSRHLIFTQPNAILGLFNPPPAPRPRPHPTRRIGPACAAESARSTIFPAILFFWIAVIPRTGTFPNSRAAKAGCTPRHTSQPFASAG